MATNATRSSRHVNAPRATVYRALLDARAVEAWMAPVGMTSHVHVFDFVKLVPDEQVVETMESGDA